MKMFRTTILSALLLAGLATSAAAADKKILLIAGRPSHGPGDHEFHAGCQLLKKCLDKVPGIRAEVHNMGWPKDDAAFADADAVLIYADGGGGHPAIKPERMALLYSLAKKASASAARITASRCPRAIPARRCRTGSAAIMKIRSA